MDSHSPAFPEVRDIIVETLSLDAGRASGLTPETLLFGGIPELDSLAVVGLAMALEERFGFVIDDSEFTAEIFETIGSLSDFVDRSMVSSSGGQAHERRAAS